MKKNSTVTTPIGKGVVQGHFEVQAKRDGVVVAQGVLVRMPINDQTRVHLNQSNCLTPRAKASGLWVFAENTLRVEQKVKA
jgi:hypothetical protein